MDGSIREKGYSTDGIDLELFRPSTSCSPAFLPWRCSAQEIPGPPEQRDLWITVRSTAADESLIMVAGRHRRAVPCRGPVPRSVPLLGTASACLSSLPRLRARRRAQLHGVARCFLAPALLGPARRCFAHPRLRAALPRRSSSRSRGSTSPLRHRSSSRCRSPAPSPLPVARGRKRVG